MARRFPVVGAAVLAASVFPLLPLQARAGTVEQANIFADVQMQVKDGELQGCGFRLKGLSELTPQTKSALVIDMSVNVYSNSVGLMKGGAVQVEVVSASPGASKNRPVTKFWAKVSGQSPTAPLNGKAIPAETKGYMLYGVETKKAFELFDAVLEGTPLMLGVQLNGESVDRIYSGTVRVSDSDKAQAQQCISELLPIIMSNLEKALENVQPERK